MLKNQRLNDDHAKAQSANKTKHRVRRPPATRQAKHVFRRAQRAISPHTYQNGLVTKQANLHTTCLCCRAEPIIKEKWCPLCEISAPVGSLTFCSRHRCTGRWYIASLTFSSWCTAATCCRMWVCTSRITTSPALRPSEADTADSKLGLRLRSFVAPCTVDLGMSCMWCTLRWCKGVDNMFYRACVASCSCSPTYRV